MDRDEIYTLKLYKFTEVDSENDVDPSMRWYPKLCGSTETHLYLHRRLSLTEWNTSFPEIWRYSFTKRKWSVVYECKSSPPEGGLCDSACLGNTLFLRTCTIRDSSPPQTSHTLCCSNLRKCGAVMDFHDMMSPISTADDKVYPPQFGGCAMTVHGEYLYLVGGATWYIRRSAVYSMDVWEFHIRTREWTRLYHRAEHPDGPPPRSDPEMVYYKRKLYIFGGYDVSIAFSSRNLLVFNLETNTWEVKNTVGDPEGVEHFPIDRRLYSIARDPHQPSIVFVHSGCDDHISIRPFNNTWRINLDTLQWKSLSRSTFIHDMSCQHSICSTPDGRLYMFGGRHRKFLVTWIMIPKLADICWDAIMFYVRKGVIKLPNDLKTLGLPEKYLNRLLCD